MKTLKEIALGSDGKIALGLDKGHITLSVGYSAKAVLLPIKKFVDGICAKIPGTLDESLAAKGFEAAEKAIDEAAK